MNKKKDTRIGYMDATDFLYELENDNSTHTVANNPLDLIANSKHDLRECGIVEVELVFKRWIKKPKLV